jgi:hypothetical protein
MCMTIVTPRRKASKQSEIEKYKKWVSIYWPNLDGPSNREFFWLSKCLAEPYDEIRRGFFRELKLSVLEGNLYTDKYFQAILLNLRLASMFISFRSLVTFQYIID